ncbi:hypothetical protein GCK32_019705 [Trichostrongylus colubriformis]|uniref:Uncharacterized protein n=1 Tax=Trichostrongylus colubriformis TaxID=6319 RepID=A0AAN8EZ69_TRICO
MTETLVKYKEEADKLAGNIKPITLRVIVKQAFDMVRTEEHRCDDLPMIWTNWQHMLYQEINAPLQGQWLICDEFYTITSSHTRNSRSRTSMKRGY